MKDEKVVTCLNKILELELAGVVKYTHYAFMVQGPYRLSIVQWLRTQAQESLTHAESVGEHITSLVELRLIILKWLNKNLEVNKSIDHHLYQI